MSELKPERCTSCGQKFLHLKCMLKDGVCIACWQSKAIAADELAEAVEDGCGLLETYIVEPWKVVNKLLAALAAYRKARGKSTPHD